MFDDDIYFNDSDFDESYDYWQDFNESNSEWEEDEPDEDYLNYAEDAMMEAHLFGDC